MLKSIRIKGLFERFDYTISLKQERLTIITGPNGYGKSTILKLINAVYENQMYGILNIPFKQVEFVFDDAFVLKISRLKESIKINDVKLSIPGDRVRRPVARRRLPPYFERISSTEYMDLRTQERIRLDDPRLLEISNIFKIKTEDVFFEHILMEAQSRNDSQKTLQTKIDDIKIAIENLQKATQSLGTVKFIREQRLLEEKVENERMYGEKSKSIINVIETLPNKLKFEIEKTLKEHSILSSKLDSTYPQRLFNAKLSVNVNSYKESINEILNQQEKLKKYGLAEIADITQTELFSEKEKELATALYIYFEDSKSKFKVFEDLIEKLDVFVKIVNNKLNFKKITISKDYGMQLVGSENEAPLKLGELSSGEQEIVVLFYQLIFEAQDNLLLLIDEPEISLHIAWQKELLDDFKNVLEIKNKKVEVIVATHSPQVINDNWHLQIDLGELYGY